MLTNSIRILKSLQYPSGLFAASALNVSTGYNKAWIRDTIYEAMGLEKHDIKAAIKAYHALLDILLKHEYKIDWAVKEKPDARFKYIHPRYDPITMEEIHEDWGNKQNDAIGALLFKIADLEKKGIKVIRGINDFRILQKLVFYLNSIEYWDDKDNGMWEENEEVHSSSVGACLAGLKKIKNLLYVPDHMIEKGQETLNRLLPRESITKEVDLAQLSLIYPYNIVTKEQALIILKNVEQILLREKGVIRYKDDQYYNENGEAEWTFGVPWLALCFKQLGDSDKYSYYLKQTEKLFNKKGELPELYFANSQRHNENSPLGWSQAMYLLAVE